MKRRANQKAAGAQPVWWSVVILLLAVIGLIAEKSWRTYQVIQSEAAKGSDQLTGYYAVMFCALVGVGFLGAAGWAAARKALGK